jgi:hypothetical protein
MEIVGRVPGRSDVPTLARPCSSRCASGAPIFAPPLAMAANSPGPKRAISCPLPIVLAIWWAIWVIRRSPAVLPKTSVMVWKLSIPMEKRQKELEAACAFCARRVTWACSWANDDSNTDREDEPGALVPADDRRHLEISIKMTANSKLTNNQGNQSTGTPQQIHQFTAL